jgi:tripartite-type tricarboxylate transporter receptor subunit TctC
MDLTRRNLLALAGSAATLPLPARAADDWPTRPIRLIVGTAPGGSPDIIGRILGEKLAPKLGQSFIIENLTSGAGAIAQLTVAKSDPDGYTLGMLTAGFPPQMALRKSLPFEPLDGFSFITLVCGYPMVYAVAPNSPIKSFPDLLAQAKASPGKLTYTINALGSIYHILTKWIEIESGTEFTPIPYRGSAPAFTDVVAGRVDLMVDTATSAFPRIRAGQLRALAVSSAERYPLLPDVPTMAETIPAVKVESWLGLAAAPNTPRPIVDRINGEIRYAMDLPEVKKWAAESGVVPAPSSPEQFRARVEGDVRQWTEVVVRNNITVQ